MYSRESYEEYIKYVKRMCETDPINFGFGGGAQSTAKEYLFLVESGLARFSQIHNPLSWADHIFVQSSILTLEYLNQLVMSEYFDDKNTCLCPQPGCRLPRVEIIRNFYKNSKYFQSQKKAK